VESILLDEGDVDNQQGQENGDEHLDHYVNNQLNRVRSQVSLGTYEDEFETQLDGSNGH
jgi:hypothetical protein